MTGSPACPKVQHSSRTPRPGTSPGASPVAAKRSPATHPATLEPADWRATLEERRRRRLDAQQARRDVRLAAWVFGVVAVVALVTGILVARPMTASTPRAPAPTTGISPGSPGEVVQVASGPMPAAARSRETLPRTATEDGRFPSIARSAIDWLAVAAAIGRQP